jgi:hypothetical protein
LFRGGGKIKLDVFFPARKAIDERWEVVLCGGVWRDVFFLVFSSMEIFQMLSKVSVEGFGQVGLEDLLSV